jgi:hypothetical protein
VTNLNPAGETFSKSFNETVLLTWRKTVHVDGGVANVLVVRSRRDHHMALDFDHTLFGANTRPGGMALLTSSVS